MSSKIKNIIILVVVAIILGLVYFFFIKKEPEQPSLVSESASTVPAEGTSSTESSVTKEFLTLLLNVKNIKINDQVLYDPAFSSLRDSTIEIVDDGSEGRPNPFAPVGTDITASPSNANASLGGSAANTAGKSVSNKGALSTDENSNTNTEGTNENPAESTQ